MNVKKCDRCGKFYIPYNPTDTTKFSNLLVLAEDREGGSYVGRLKFDMCEDCMKDLLEFMQTKLN